MHSLLNSYKNKSRLRIFLSFTASFLEILLAILLACALTISVFQLIPSLFELDLSIENTGMFQDYLESLFVIVIGVEALKLLCTHTPGDRKSVV